MNRALTTGALLALLVGALAVLGPLTGWYKTTTVLTGSMRPTINPGDVVVTRPLPTTDVKVGDILTFQQPDGAGTITHRVAAVGRDHGKLHIVTKGDANESVDGYDVTFVHGTAWRTVKVIPKVGYAFVALRALLSAHLYMPIIGILLFFSLLWTIWRPEREEADVSPA